MSNWFRFYDDVVNDPKLIKLPDDLYRAWVNLLCIAAKNDGVLPDIEDVAVVLRVKTPRAAELITKLVKAKLLDDNGGVFSPHNWQGRQFKSDDAGARVKKHREKLKAATDVTLRNVTQTTLRNATEEKRRETEQNTTEARDPLKVRTGDFQQAIVRAFAAANSPNLPETSRAGLWLSQGYQEDICLAVITDIVKRKPSITTLSYFDNPIADAHAKKAPPREAVVMTAEETDWEAVCKSYKAFGKWSKWAGPDPDSEACRCPRDVLAKHGLLPISDAPSLPIPTMPSMQ